MNDKLNEIETLIREYTTIYDSYSSISNQISEIKDNLIDLESQRLYLKGKLDENRLKEKEFMTDLQKNDPDTFNNIKKFIESKIKKMIQ